MAGNAQNIRLGPCRVIWGVEDLGFTKGGVEVTFTSTQVNITSDQFGDTPMDKYLTSRTVKAKVPLIETIPGKLDLIVNGGDGTAELADVQTVAGLSIRDSSQSLTLHPLSKADDDHSEDFVIVRAGVIPNFSATYDTDNERVWNVTFTSFPYYGEFGDIMGADKAGVVVYGDRSSVVAAGGLWRKSNRTTIGTYFDKNGIMQTTPAGVTRPNFVYKNGVWKQEGWLLEGQATNLCWIDTTNKQYVSTNPNGFGSGIPSYVFNPASIFNALASSTLSSNLQIAVSSTRPAGADAPQSSVHLYIKKTSDDVGVNIEGNWYYGPKQNINLKTGVISDGPPQGDIIKVEDCGDWWNVIWIWEIATNSINSLFNFQPIQGESSIPTATAVEIAGGQWETTPNDNPFGNTSYIPTTNTSVTRAAD